jgi:hypothetical protein
MARLHLALTFAWVLLVVPTLLWWKDSILWVSLMSWYAIVVSHLSAYAAARAECAIEAKAKEPERRVSV